MRSYCALYVDAGYLLASAATRVTGTSLRGAISVNHTNLIRGLIEQAEKDSGLPLLRLHWYDAGSNPGGQADHIQHGLGMMPRVKLRLGRLSPNGEQKGVDIRLGLDLVTHGRNRIIDVAYLVSGDDDLSEAVEECQGHGVRVLLLAAPSAEDRPYAVSQHLQREADGLVVIEPSIIDGAVTRRKTPPMLAPAAPAEGDAAAAAQQTTPEPDAEAKKKPAVPSPADLAKHTPAAVAPTTRTTRPAVPSSDLVYSSVTGAVSPSVLSEEDDPAIDEVVRGVFTAWRSSVGEPELASLRRNRPDIPRDVDRALLVDLSAKLGEYDIPERMRFRLRNRFWEVVDEDAP